MAAKGSLIDQYNKLLAKLSAAQLQSSSSIRNVGNLTLPQLMQLEQGSTAQDKAAQVQLAKSLAAPRASTDAATKQLMADLSTNGGGGAALAPTVNQGNSNAAASSSALDQYSQALSNQLAQQNTDTNSYASALQQGAQSDVNNKVALDRYNAQQQLAQAQAAGGGGGGGGGGFRRGGGGGSGGGNQGLTEAQINSLSQKLVGLKGNSGRIDQKTLDQLVGANNVDLNNPFNAQAVHEIEQRVLGGYGPDTTAHALQAYLQANYNPTMSQIVPNSKQGVDANGNPLASSSGNPTEAGKKYSPDTTALDNFIQAIGQREGGIGNPMTQQDAENNYLNDFGWNFNRLTGVDPGPHPATLQEGSPYGAWNPDSVMGQDSQIQNMDPAAALDFINRHPAFQQLDSSAFGKLTSNQVQQYAKSNPQYVNKIPALKLLLAQAQSQRADYIPPAQKLAMSTPQYQNMLQRITQIGLANSHRPQTLALNMLTAQPQTNTPSSPARYVQPPLAPNPNGSAFLMALAAAQNGRINQQITSGPLAGAMTMPHR